MQARRFILSSIVLGALTTISFGCESKEGPQGPGRGPAPAAATAPEQGGGGLLDRLGKKLEGLEGRFEDFADKHGFGDELDAFKDQLGDLREEMQ